MSDLIWGFIGLFAFVGGFWLLYRMIQTAQAGDRLYDNGDDYGQWGDMV